MTERLKGALLVLLGRAEWYQEETLTEEEIEEMAAREDERWREIEWDIGAKAYDEGYHDGLNA